MTIQIITSSYPSSPDDPTAAAGLFVREMALELVRCGHKVVVLVAGRSPHYTADRGIIIERLSWLGGRRELASLPLINPVNYFYILHFFLSGCHHASRTSTKHSVDRNLCMWIVPSGIFGWWVKKMHHIPYDVWALGSDIWKIRKVPFGKMLLKSITGHAARAYADGIGLKREAESITGIPFDFLASSRTLPKPDSTLAPLRPEGITHFIYVGRYHKNKGPDTLVEAVALLSATDRRKLKVHMFGYGAMKAELENFIEKTHLRETIATNGPISAAELSGYLARCDYLVIPSRKESIPVVLSDAVLRGLPVIVSDAGDMGEIVTSNNAGYVFPLGQPALLADKLSEALSTDGSIFAIGVRALAMKFDIRQSCALWLENSSDLNRR